MLFLYWEVQSWTQHCRCLSGPDWKGRLSSLCLPAVLRMHCCPCGAKACCWPVLQIGQKWFSPSLWKTYCSAFVTSPLPTPNANLNHSNSTVTFLASFPLLLWFGCGICWSPCELTQPKENSLDICKENWTLSHSSFWPLESFSSPHLLIKSIWQWKGRWAVVSHPGTEWWPARYAEVGVEDWDKWDYSWQQQLNKVHHWNWIFCNIGEMNISRPVDSWIS